jgi:organic radical activating enzyme
MNKTQAELVEVFSSIQGEGVLVGLRQIFIRFSQCNLSCNYCDTESLSQSGCCKMETNPGRRDFRSVINPVTLEQIISLISNWKLHWPDIHHSASITGGEPLLQFETLLNWLPAIRKYLPIYLETNGVLHKELASVITLLDYIGMDIKLPSASGCQELWEEHQEFLSIASTKNVFVKVVVNAATQDWEVNRACKIIAAVNRNIPLILQPVTSPDGNITITPYRLLELQELASTQLAEIRVIPQTHKFIGQL